jgi:hypothetical protein
MEASNNASRQAMVRVGVMRTGRTMDVSRNNSSSTEATGRADAKSMVVEVVMVVGKKSMDRADEMKTGVELRGGMVSRATARPDARDLEVALVVGRSEKAMARPGAMSTVVDLRSRNRNRKVIARRSLAMGKTRITTESGGRGMAMIIEVTLRYASAAHAGS